MLFFVKKRFADALADGTKKYELRPDISRYKKLTQGKRICVNGRSYYRILKITRFSSIGEVSKKIAPSLCGFKTSDEMKSAWLELYPDNPSVLALLLEPYTKE